MEDAKGVVVRRRSPEDERRVLVSLTDEGAERLALLGPGCGSARARPTRRSPRPSEPSS
ncbi:hypothetical protein [Streptomyces sp. NPDC054794]